MSVSAVLEAEKVLSNLSPAQKAHLLQSMSRDLSDVFPGVEKKPGVCGGSACIASTRIPVWLLEQLRRLGMSEADLLRGYPSLQANDLVNAWAYVRTHREEIEEDIRLNEQDDEDEDD